LLSANGGRDITNTENQPPTAVASTSHDGVDGMQLSDVGGSRRVFSGTDVVNKNEAAHVIASKRKNCRAVQKKRKKRSSSKGIISATRNKKDCCCLISSDNNRDLASVHKRPAQMAKALMGFCAISASRKMVFLAYNNQ